MKKIFIVILLIGLCVPAYASDNQLETTNISNFGYADRKEMKKVVNQLNRVRPVSLLLKKVLKIHPDRPLPLFPKESFFFWAEKRGLNSPKSNNARLTSNVAYFAGRSAGYLFPEVGKAAVRILERNGIEVHIPPQECCSMPLPSQITSRFRYHPGRRGHGVLWYGRTFRI